MKKLTKKQKEYLLQKSKKEMLRRSRIKKHYINKQASTNNTEQSNKHYKNKDIILTAPQKLSLFENSEETVQYFKKVHTSINGCLPNANIFFDLSSVCEISVDAVMYIIALLHNEKKLQNSRIICGGNEPNTPEARKVINDVGFYEYVKSKAFHQIDHNSKLIRIHRGYKPDYTFAARICDFIHTVSDNQITRVGTKRLYAMLVELMNNTYQHAYENKVEADSLYCNWYIYVEDKKNTIRFVFLDTGLGISKTIRRSIWEKAADVFRENDAKYISSALRGEFRTQTEKEHRGKGLPEIYENVKIGKINSLHILSGHGICDIYQNGVINEKVIESDFQGTLYAWELNKECKYDY